MKNGYNKSKVTQALPCKQPDSVAKITLAEPS